MSSLRHAESCGDLNLEDCRKPWASHQPSRPLLCMERASALGDPCVGAPRRPAQVSVVALFQPWMFQPRLVVAGGTPCVAHLVAYNNNNYYNNKTTIVLQGSLLFLVTLFWLASRLEGESLASSRLRMDVRGQGSPSFGSSPQKLNLNLAAVPAAIQTKTSKTLKSAAPEETALGSLSMEPKKARCFERAKWGPGSGVRGYGQVELNSLALDSPDVFEELIGSQHCHKSSLSGGGAQPKTQAPSTL